jgi:mRNA (guanine-N7-)-methyltransferase
MRRFHNNVKRELYDKYTRDINKLLDLACGKGGDLDKWVSNNIKSVVGYDINERSILEARRRVNEYKYPINTKVDVNVRDLSRNVIDGNKDCDVVTSMFAFHYFFETEETFNTIMKSIDNNLKEDGYFIGAMFDGESIRNVLKNNVYILKDKDDIKFKIEAYNQLNDNAFGNKISVYLKDTVLDEPMDEYVVYFDKFVSLMKERGYELVESKMFKDLDEKSKMNIIEKSVSYLNRYFVFKRTSKGLCKQESNYLTVCDWPFNIEEIKRERLLKKYKKALDNKIMKASSSKDKIDYMFIRDNFEKYEDIIETVSSITVKNYFKKIYDMYIEDLKK